MFLAKIMVASTLVLASGTESNVELPELAAQRYADCLTMARQSPKDGVTFASTWMSEAVTDADSRPARHCLAVALIGLGRYDEAAKRLELMALEIPEDRADLQLGLLMQAGQAWTLAGRLRRAEEVQSQAIEIAPREPALYIDRATSRLTREDHWKAVDDLSVALELDPTNVHALLFLASAYRYLDALELAVDYAERAVELDPNYAAGFLERGILRQLNGDLDGARKDWVRVLELEQDGDVAEAARFRLEEMDVTSR